MPAIINNILLTIGNEIIQSFRKDKELAKCAPKDSWQVSYEVDDSTLLFRVYLDYHLFSKEFARIPADPALWVTLVTFSVTQKIREHGSALPHDLSIGFVINRGNAEAGSLKMLCNIADLLEATDKAKENYLDDAAKIIMAVMKDNAET